VDSWATSVTKEVRIEHPPFAARRMMLPLDISQRKKTCTSNLPPIDQIHQILLSPINVICDPY
jgi:hypothetical protein